MARKDVTAVVSGAGWIAGFADKLIRALRERNVTDEQIHSLVTDDGEAPVGKIADMLAEMMHPRGVFKVVVDYARSIAEMIQLGHYDSVNNDITADHFPGVGADTVELVAQLYHFNRVMESDDVLEELDKLGLRPATLRELLAFGAQYPDTQRQFPIIALGSVWQGRSGSRDVPGLWGGAGGRDLDLRWPGHGWRESFRFLVFRK